MVSDDQIKNIVQDQLSALAEILSGVLTGKTATKAVNAITAETSHEMLFELVKKHLTEIEKTVKKTSKTSKSVKKKKDPAAPKKNCSSYIFFCKDMRESVKSENPDLKGTEITKEIANLWKKLEEDDKGPFIEKAEADKQRYLDEMKSYTPSEGFSNEESEGKTKAKKTKKTRKPGPKKASSSYLFFCKEERSKVKALYPDMDSKDITRELGRVWKEEMTDKKKKKFEKLAAEDKARYEEEKESWVDPSSKEEDGHSDSDSSSEQVVDKKIKKTKKSKSSITPASIASSSDDYKSDSDDDKKKTKPIKKSKSQTSTDNDKSDSDTGKKTQKKNRKKSTDNDKSDSDTGKKVRKNQNR
jgi:high mobility group protein B1